MGSCTEAALSTQMSTLFLQMLGDSWSKRMTRSARATWAIWLSFSASGPACKEAASEAVQCKTVQLGPDSGIQLRQWLWQRDLTNNRNGLSILKWFALGRSMWFARVAVGIGVPLKAQAPDI